MPRISAGSAGEDREQVHQRVFDALAVLLTKRSIDAITMAQLAAAAGLGRTTIHHHFPDKEAVVVSLSAQETSRRLEGLRAGLQGVEGPVERVRVYVRHQLDADRQLHPGLDPRLHGALSNGSRLTIRSHATQVEQVLRDVIAAGVLTGDLTVDDEAATMSLVHACLSPRDVPVDLVEGFVLRALGVRDP